MSKSAALFGRPQQPQARHLLQFKAGKMTQDSENWVRPDPRKGWVYVYQAGDGKLHICWIDRKTCLVEENFVINPKQAEFKRVTQCTSGRVYLLKLKDSKRFFIWMQEPNGKNDSDICSRINDYIKSPPAHTTANTTDWMSRLERLTENEMLTLLSMGVGLGSGISSESDVSSAQATAVTIGRHLNTGHLEPPLASIQSTVPAVSTTPSTGLNMATGRLPEAGKFQLQDLRGILSSIPKAQMEPEIDLNDAINVDGLRSLLSKPDVQARLLPYLPPMDPDSECVTSVDQLTTNIRSSQFKSTLKSFSAAFQTGDLSPLLTQFKLGPKADEAAKRGDLVAFSKALENTDGVEVSSGSKLQTDSGSQDQKPDKETPMDTD